MEYRIIKDYRNDEGLRRSFNQLAGEVFGLSFENWYQGGFWGDAYNPYSIVIGDEVVANVSVNLIDCELNGQLKHYIQLGTVMTKEGFRGRGYSRILMERVLRDCAGSDGVFLYANDGVLDFYPKFGFKEVREYRYRAAVKGGRLRAVPVAMNTQEDFARFLQEKNQRKSCGLLNMHTDGLMMFHLTQFMRENVYFIEHLDCYAIAEIEGDTLSLFDVYSKGSIDMAAVCAAFGGEIKRAEFMLTPGDTSGLERHEHKADDTTLFVLGDRLVREMEAIGGFPELAHA